MSLIMDALKKAQQLRSNDAKGGPFFKHDRRNMGAGRRKWKILGGSVITMLALLLIFWWVVLMDAPTPPPKQLISLIEQKPAQPSAETESPGVTLDKNPGGMMTESHPVPGVTPERLPSPLPTPHQENEPVIEKREDEIGLVKSVPETKMAGVAPVEPKTPVEKKVASPPTPPPQKEEDPVPSIRAGPVSGKDHLRTTEIIHHFNQGISFYHQGEIPKAIQAYRKVIEMDPAYVEAYNNLGIIYQETGDLDSALKTYQKAVEINPSYEKGLNNIGILHLLRGEDQKAEEVFQKVLTINPTHIETHINLGTLYKRMGQLDKGIESYRKAIGIRATHGEAHYNLGLLYEQMGNRELAVQHYRQFVESSSNTYPDLASRVRRHIQQLQKTKEGKKE